MKTSFCFRKGFGSLKKASILAGFLFVWSSSGPAAAAVLIDMPTYFGEFDGDVAGDTAGPFLDTVSNVSGTITSVLITDEFGAAGASLDFTNSQSGINNTSISGLESWTFEWNVNAQFLQIDLSALGAGFNASIQSDAWIGASITPGSSNVSFDSLTGTFQFDGNQAGDNFTTANIYGTSTIPVISAGTDITIASVSGNSFSIGSGFTWELAAVPEPVSAGLVGLALGSLVLFRRRA